jgi:crossover junction endodeoxyribonuclease RuvC
MLILGVDPGLTGALALVDVSRPQLVDILDMPVIRDGNTCDVDGTVILDWLDNRGVACIHIEHVASSPQMGVASAYKFGCMAGGVRAILRATPWPMHSVSPGVWKRRAGLSKDKRASLDKASTLFGSIAFARMKDDGRAEAALIAYFGRPLDMLAHAA